MKSAHYHEGYKRGAALLGPMHHSLEGQDMNDYLDGFRAGQSATLVRNRGGHAERRVTHIR